MLYDGETIIAIPFISSFFFFFLHINGTSFKSVWIACLHWCFLRCLYLVCYVYITTSSLNDFMYILYINNLILIHISITTYQYYIHTTVLFIRSIKAILLAVAPKYRINTVAIITLVLTGQTCFGDFSCN